MKEELKPQIDEEVLIGHLLEEEREQLAELSRQPGWKILMEKIVKPRGAAVIRDVVTSPSDNKDDIFRDIIFTRGQLREHWLIQAIVSACRKKKQ